MSKSLLSTPPLKIRLALAATIALSLILTGCGSEVQEETLTIPVEVAPVQTRTLYDTRQFSGTLRSSAQYIIAPKVSGQLEGLVADIGDTVEKGQLVAWISDQEFVQNVAQANAQLEVAKARLNEARSSLDSARREFNRIDRLRDQRVASESEYDAALSRLRSAEAGVKVAEAQVQQAEASLKTAEIQLSYTRIHADWRGEDQVRVVGQRFVSEGNNVRAFEPMLSVLALDPLTAVVQVTQDDYPRLSPGQPVEITTDAFPDRTFKAEVARIAPEFNEASRQAQVEMRVPNDDRLLKPGMFINARLVFDKIEGATVVPYEALVQRENRQSVFVVEGTDGDQLRARLVPVEVGLREGDLVQIVKPEISGRVVSLGQHMLDDGSPIRIPEQKRQASGDGA